MSTRTPLNCGYWRLIASAIRQPPLEACTASAHTSGVMSSSSLGELYFVF